MAPPPRATSARGESGRRSAAANRAAVPWIVDVTKPAAGGGGAAGGSNAMGAARWKKTLQKGEAATQKAAKGKAGAKSTVVQKL